MLWVESLLGGGHMQVADTLAQALVGHGLETHVVSSGFGLSPGLNYGGAVLHPYPKNLHILSDEQRGYVTADNRRLADAPDMLVRRHEFFMNVAARVSPDAVITEHWPFRRGYLDPDIGRSIAALTAQPVPPLIYGSVRDAVLVKPGDSAGGTPETAAVIINRHYRKIFVHGDAQFLPLERSFPAAAAFTDKLAYTGYLVHPLPPRDARCAANQRPVLVSAGGGKTVDGLQLYETAINTRAALPPCHPLATNPWQIMVSAAYAEADFQRLRQQAAARGGSVQVLRNLPAAEFRHTLSNAALSISLCGYNTAIETYAADVPAVLLPFINAAGGQRLRAEAFTRDGKMSLLAPDQRTDPASLLHHVDKVWARRDWLAPPLKLDGEQLLAQTVAADIALRLQHHLAVRRGRRHASQLSEPTTS